MITPPSTTPMSSLQGTVHQQCRYFHYTGNRLCHRHYYQHNPYPLFDSNYNNLREIRTHIPCKWNDDAKRQCNYKHIFLNIFFEYFHVHNKWFEIHFSCLTITIILLIYIFKLIPLFQYTLQFQTKLLRHVKHLLRYHMHDCLNKTTRNVKINIPKVLNDF